MKILFHNTAEYRHRCRAVSEHMYPEGYVDNNYRFFYHYNYLNSYCCLDVYTHAEFVLNLETGNWDIVRLPDEYYNQMAGMVDHMGHIEETVDAALEKSVPAANEYSHISKEERKELPKETRDKYKRAEKIVFVQRLLTEEVLRQFAVNMINARNKAAEESEHDVFEIWERPTVAKDWLTYPDKPESKDTFWRFHFMPDSNRSKPYAVFMDIFANEKWREPRRLTAIEALEQRRKPIHV